jgi:hypothetical protein
MPSYSQIMLYQVSRASTKPVTLTHINHYTIQKSVYTSERYKASPMEELILKKNEEQTQYRIWKQI